MKTKKIKQTNKQKLSIIPNMYFISNIHGLSFVSKIIINKSLSSPLHAFNSWLKGQETHGILEIMNQELK